VPASVQVQISGFVLPTFTVAKGTSVTWTNKDAAPHTSTSGSGGVGNGMWNSGTLGTNGTFTFVFATAGSFPYTCIFHSSMNATVTVTG